MPLVAISTRTYPKLLSTMIAWRITFIPEDTEKGNYFEAEIICGEPLREAEALGVHKLYNTRGCKRVLGAFSDR